MGRRGCKKDTRLQDVRFATYLRRLRIAKQAAWYYENKETGLKVQINHQGVDHDQHAAKNMIDFSHEVSVSDLCMGDIVYVYNEAGLETEDEEDKSSRRVWPLGWYKAKVVAARLDVRRGMKVEAKWERKWYAATVQTVWEQTCEVRFDIDGTWEEVELKHLRPPQPAQ